MATGDFVTQLFQNMFGRTPSATELNLWGGRIESGAESSSQAAVDLLSSPEGVNATAIERLYQAAFGRTPDLAGFKMQVGSGLSADTLAHNFVGSAEFQTSFVNPNGGAFDVTNFATKLYTNILGRAPDSGGLAVQVNFYNSLIATGHADADARATLLQNFANSPEFVGNIAVNLDKAVLLWAGLDNTIPVSTTAAPSTMMLQANAIPPLTLATTLNDGINGDDISPTPLGNTKIQVLAGPFGITTTGTSSGDTFDADWASLQGATIVGGAGNDALLIRNAAGSATVTLDSVEQLVVTAATGPVILTLNVTGATNLGQIDTLEVMGASGTNKVTIAANGVENVIYDAYGAPGAPGSVIDFNGNSFLANLTVRGSQGFAVSGFAGNLTPGLKVDASAATGGGTLDLRSYAPGATILGGSGGNTIFGSSSSDTITGGRGNDVIAGGEGIDTLTGGGGDDLFRFDFNFMRPNDAPRGNLFDTITDFSRASPDVAHFDRIQIGIVGIGVGGRIAVAGDKAGVFNGLEWSVANGVFRSGLGAPHLNGGALAPQVLDVVAPNLGDAFVYSTGDFSVGDTYLFVQGGDNDMLIRLQAVPLTGKLNLLPDNVFYLS